MGHVFLEITISLDGFSAAPNIDSQNPLGVGGERLHEWNQNPVTETDREVAGSMFVNTGAFLIGRRTFDLGIDLWGDDGAFRKPCFVVTHRPEDVLIKGPTRFTFVTDGIENALKHAQATAGDQNVCIMGGAELAQQYLAAGLVDEIRLHIVPLLLGTGTRLFDHLGTQPIELEQTRLIETPHATHLTFRVNKGASL